MRQANKETKALQRRFRGLKEMVCFLQLDTLLCEKCVSWTWESGSLFFNLFVVRFLFSILFFLNQGVKRLMESSGGQSDGSERITTGEDQKLKYTRYFYFNCLGTQFLLYE